uniref:PDZ domain-containing protein n=2 Tax=Haemonchus contortus TaxID=6289 RepID=A0A7I4Y359_HAECO
MLRPTMSYETISVRMNRSDPKIRWGFTLRQQGAKLAVATVETDSLSDKAGMRPNDEVDSICGRDAKNMSVHEANSIIDRSYQEVQFNLRRYVTSHTCLPWTLTEQDNKLVVDEVRPGFGTGFGTGSSFGNRAVKHSSQYNSSWDRSRERSIPIQQRTSQHGNYTSHSGSNRTTHHGSYVTTNAQPRLYHSPSAYTTRHDQSTYSKHETKTAPQGNGYIPTYSSQSKANYESGSRDSSRTHQGTVGAGGGYSSNINQNYTSKFGNDRYSTLSHTTPAAQNYSYNNGMTTTAYKASSGGTPLNQATFIQTSHSPSLHSSYLSPGGTRIYYHSPSPRTRRELAPNASIEHLLHRTPENIQPVRSASATEQYIHQQERPTEMSTTFRSHSPAYLTSEAKRLIEEQAQGRDHRVASPSAQSSSFKRISQAVGQPVK